MLTVTVISTKTEWITSGSPYTGTYVVEDGATLTIDSGVVVQASLAIDDNGSGGSLSAQQGGVTFGNNSSLALDYGATATLTGDTFNGSVYLYANSSPTLSGDSFASGDLYVAPQLVARSPAWPTAPSRPIPQ